MTDEGPDTRLPEERPQTEGTMPILRWIDGYEERMRNHILFALTYVKHFNHGAPGHLDLITIATLARQLSFALDEDLPSVKP